jgi:DHA1 family multidrug resistance protein-like MFS transporter
MLDLIRDAPIGQIIRLVTKNRLLKYPEELDTFECPNDYAKAGSGQPDDAKRESLDAINVEKPAAPNEAAIPEDKVLEEVETPQSRASTASSEGLDKIPTAQEGAHLEGIQSQKTHRSQIERVGTRTALQKSRTQADLEAQVTLALQEKGPTLPLVPERLDDGTILVDWYTTDDQANPQNWSLRKRGFVALQI